MLATIATFNNTSSSIITQATSPPHNKQHTTNNTQHTTHTTRSVRGLVGQVQQQQRARRAEQWRRRDGLWWLRELPGRSLLWGLWG